MWIKLRFKSVCIYAKSEQSPSFWLEETLDPWLPIERASQTLIRLNGCVGWSESSMGAHDNVYLLLDTGLFVIILLMMVKLIMMVVLPANCCIQQTRTVPRPFFH